MQETKENVKLFMNIEIGSKPVGTIIFRMFNNVCPKTCKNFIKLCCKTAGFSKTTGKALCYKGSTIHKVIPGFIIQGGDFTCNNGTGGESIYETKFEDENFKISHDKPGLLTMANSGPNSNTSQFIITCQPCKWLDGKNVVFGEVIQGFEVCAQIQKVRTNSRDQPLIKITIKDCGEIIQSKKSRKSCSSSSRRSKGKRKKNRQSLIKEKSSSRSKRKSRSKNLSRSRSGSGSRSRSKSRSESRSRSKSRSRSRSRKQKSKKVRSRSRSKEKSKSKPQEENKAKKNGKNFHKSCRSKSSSSIDLSNDSFSNKKEIYYRRNRDKSNKSDQKISHIESRSLSHSRLRSYSNSLSRSHSYSQDSYRSDSR